MHTLERVRHARVLMARGLGDAAISRALGLPRTTIRDWRTRRADTSRPECPVCTGAALDEDRYAYLLGLYLGDGCLSEHRRAVFKLRIVLDARYPAIIDECSNAIRSLHPERAIHRIERSGCREVIAYWKHWPCLFPQHAPGKKHERRIDLLGWQSDLVRRHPGALLRGLIHSDGSRASNRVVRSGRPYVYPRYQFKNRSCDILSIFADACRSLGIRCSRGGSHAISVARRIDVQALDRLVGPKA